MERRCTSEKGRDTGSETYVKRSSKTLVCDLTRPLLNCNQTSQAPGASTVECPKGIDVCDHFLSY